MTNSWKTGFSVICLLLSLKFSAAENAFNSQNDLDPLKMGSPNSDKEMKKELLSALRRADTDTAELLILQGALDDHFVSSDEIRKGKSLGTIRDKLQVVGILKKWGIVTAPTAVRPKADKSEEVVLNVTIVPGTDLVMILNIDLAVVKSWTNETLLKLGKVPLFVMCALPGVTKNVVKQIVDHGTIDVNFKDENNLTALMIAASQGNLDVVKYLIDKGADVNTTGFHKFQGGLGARSDFLKIFTKKDISVPLTIIHYSALVGAAYENHSEVVKYLLEKGADVNVKGQGWVPLSDPSFFDRTEVMKILLDGGMDINKKDWVGATALHKVAENGNVRAAKLLLKYGANVNSTDTFGWTPLHVAALFSANSTRATIELLLEWGSNINALTDSGFSPLNLAEAGSNRRFLGYLVGKFDMLNLATEHVGLKEIDSDKAHAEIITMMLEKGADLNHQDDIFGWTTLHWATASGDLRVTRILVEKYQALMTSSKMGMTPYGSAKHFAEDKNESNSEHVTDYLQFNTLESNKDKRVSLVSAFRQGKIKLLNNLIREGALKDYYLGIYDNKESKTLEKIQDKVRIVGMILELGLAVIPSDKFLKCSTLEAGLFEVTLLPGTDLTACLLANLTAVGNEMLVKSGYIPLHVICALPDVPAEIVKLFLDYGTVDVDEQDVSNQFTALMIAAARGNIDVMKLLLKNGADINKTVLVPLNPTGRLGFHYDYMKLFTMQHIIIPETNLHFSALVTAVLGDFPEVLRYMLKKSADVRLRGQSWIILFNAAYTGKMETMEILLKNGIDVNNRDILGSTALHKAVEKGDMAMTNLLLKYGADANATDNFGWTPLHVAALFSQKSMIEILLDRSCDINAMTDSGFSPLNLAEAGHDLHFLDYLVKNTDPTGYNRSWTYESDQEHVNMMRLMINKGADPNHFDNYLGWTTLHWAAAAGDLSVAKMLVEDYEVSMAIKSKEGLTPFKTSKHFGRSTLSHYLNPYRNVVI